LENVPNRKEDKLNLTSKNWKAQVLKSKIPVLVDFTAGWCGPCQLLAPLLKELGKELKGKLKVCKLDVDKQMKLAEQYGVHSMPTLLMFVGGEVVGSRVGLLLKRELRSFVKKVAKV
jgi:thioredoxin 1